MSLRHFWNFRNFWNFANFEISNANYGQMTIIIAIFSWFLMRMASSIFWYSFRVIGRVLAKVPKNGRIGAHGLNCKIFVNSELRFEIYDEKNFMSLRPFWNFRHPAWPVPRRDSLLIRYIRIIRSLFLQVNEKLNFEIFFK